MDLIAPLTPIAAIHFEAFWTHHHICLGFRTILNRRADAAIHFSHPQRHPSFDWRVATSPGFNHLVELVGVHGAMLSVNLQ
jgi:hypothetical protein